MRHNVFLFKTSSILVPLAPAVAAGNASSWFNKELGYAKLRDQDLDGADIMSMSPLGPTRASYNTVKHGVIGFIKSLAVEWAGNGIRVNGRLHMTS